MLFVTLGIFTHVRFFSVFVFWIFIVLLILCGRKGPQIVLLILVVYLFLSLICLFVIFPISLSPLKNHEMWLYLILISRVCSPLASLYSLPYSFLFFFLPVLWPSTLHMGVTPKLGHAITRFSKKINPFKILARHAILWVHIRESPW